MSRGTILTNNVGRRASTFRNPDQLRNAEGQIGQLSGLSTSAFNAQNRTTSPYISPLGSFAKGEQTYSNIEKMFAEIRGDGIHGVHYEKVIPLLVEAVKELTKRLEGLEHDLRFKK